MNHFYRLLQTKTKLSVYGAYALCFIVCVIGFLGWGVSYQWQVYPLNLYQLFPLLGILAFSIMWTHYIVGAFKRALSLNNKLFSNFYKYTGKIVLVLICLHPGLLIYQRYKDGFGLPPGSYTSYVAPGLGWITILGTVCFFIFIALEFEKYFKKLNSWQYLLILGDAAMLGIVYHSLKLGTALQQGWFKSVWWIYALSLIGALFYKYQFEIKNKGVVEEW